MSIIYCEFCNKNIDIDFDAEHFIDENLEYCIEKEEYDLEKKQNENKN